jgi:hypothetical protein
VDPLPQYRNTARHNGEPDDYWCSTNGPENYNLWLTK